MSALGYRRRAPSTGTESETESTTDVPSTSESSYNPSETSGDRDFVVSDAEILSPCSSSGYSGENDTSDSADDISVQGPHAHTLRPIKVLAKRSINRGGRAATQYLVLCCSWEDTDRITGPERGAPTVQSCGWCS
ncbi:hypothetical protein NYO67_4602 [Aspergillus flavus]|nr:hypothetical protein NYO67_4602 [Aspergillus flavus]